MAADLGLLSSTQHQKLAQSHQEQHHQQQSNPSLTTTTSSWMWNSTRQAAPDEDDSWEVRAFAEDTGNIMGTTWPPRSYSCTFCRREFRSAQALGGHMNVHRRDRARLRHSPPGSGAGTGDPASSSPTSSSSSGLIFPTQDYVTNGGLCLLYPLPNPSCSIFNTASMNGCVDYDHSHPSTLLSVSPFPSTTNDNFMMTSCLAPPNFPAVATSVHASSVSISRCSKVAETYNNADDDDDHNNKKKNKSGKEAIEELDLELRLGSKP